MSSKKTNTKIIGAIALLLMLFAMMMYVISDDEAIEPVADQPAAANPADALQQMPAADAPAAE